MDVNILYLPETLIWTKEDFSFKNAFIPRLPINFKKDENSFVLPISVKGKSTHEQLKRLNRCVNHLDV